MGLLHKSLKSESEIRSKVKYLISGRGHICIRVAPRWPLYGFKSDSSMISITPKEE